MINHKIGWLLLSVLLVFALMSPAIAEDLAWAQSLNLSAENDPAGFRACLAARFRIGDAEVEAVLRDVANPADAYLIFRLGEMSARSTDDVLQKYKVENRGWGSLAKSLGIKPGSKEFQDLKRAPDIEYVSHRNNGGKKKKHKSKS